MGRMFEKNPGEELMTDKCREVMRFERKRPMVRRDRVKNKWLCSSTTLRLDVLVEGTQEVNESQGVLLLYIQPVGSDVCCLWRLHLLPALPSVFRRLKHAFTAEASYTDVCCGTTVLRSMS